MSNCYPTYRTVFDRAMQRQHSDCCLPEKHEPCYPQKSDAPPKRENYASQAGDIYLKSKSKLKSGQPYLSGHPAGLQARDVYLLESKKNKLKSGTSRDRPDGGIDGLDGLRLQGRWDRYRPGGCGRHCGDGFCTVM